MKEGPERFQIEIQGSCDKGNYTFNITSEQELSLEKKYEAVVVLFYGLMRRLHPMKTAEELGYMIMSDFKKLDAERCKGMN